MAEMTSHEIEFELKRLGELCTLIIKRLDSNDKMEQLILLKIKTFEETTDFNEAVKLKNEVVYFKKFLDILTRRVDLTDKQNNLIVEDFKIFMNIKHTEGVVINRHEKEVKQLRSDVNTILEHNRLLSEFVETHLKVKAPLQLTAVKS